MTASEFAPTRPTIPIRETPFLRWVLAVDGAVSALNGLVYLVAAGAVGDQLDLPKTLLMPVGAFLIVYGSALMLMSSRERLNPAWVRTVVVLNTIWVIDSILVASTGWFDPSGTGVAWILLQAAVVAGFVAAQLAGLRRARG